MHVVFQVQNIISALAVEVAGRGEGRELLRALLPILLLLLRFPPLLGFLLCLDVGFGVGDAEGALGLVLLDLGARALARSRHD